MFENPTFNPAGMSDDELLQKNNELQSKIVWANRYGSAQMIAGLQQILSLIEDERMMRVHRIYMREMEARMRDVIETDPVLASMGEEKAVAEKTKIVPTSKPRPTIQTTSQPTTDF